MGPVWDAPFCHFLHDQRQRSTPECIQILSGECPLNNTQVAACSGPDGAHCLDNVRCILALNGLILHMTSEEKFTTESKGHTMFFRQTKEQAAPSHWDGPLFLFHLHSFLPLVNCPHYTAPNKYECLRKALSDSWSCHPFLSVQTHPS